MNYTVSLTRGLGTSYTEQIAEGMLAHIQDTCDAANHSSFHASSYGPQDKEKNVEEKQKQKIC